MSANSVPKAAATDGQALSSLVLAGAAVLFSQLWVVAGVLAIAAISLALSSRRRLRAGEALRGRLSACSGS